jgi:tetratricopeptide (TPR) repeat protein
MLYNMGDALVRVGVYQKALTHIKASLAMQKRIYKNQDHPLIAATCYSLGEAIEGLDRLNEAIPYYRQAVSIASQPYNKEYPHVTKYLNGLIELLKKARDNALTRQTQK